MLTGPNDWEVTQTEEGWVASYEGTPMWTAFPTEAEAWTYIEGFEYDLLYDC
jgi:hypothetical protein